MPAMSVSRNTSLPAAEEGLSAGEPSGLCPGRTGHQSVSREDGPAPRAGRAGHPCPRPRATAVPHGARAVSPTAVTAAISRVYRVHASAPKGLECQACVLGLPELPAWAARGHLLGTLVSALCRGVM